MLKMLKKFEFILFLVTVVSAIIALLFALHEAASKGNIFEIATTASLGCLLMNEMISRCD